MMKVSLIALAVVLAYAGGLITAYSSEPSPPPRPAQIDTRQASTPRLPWPVWIDMRMGYHEIGPAPLQNWPDGAMFLLEGFSQLMLNSEGEAVTTFTVRVARQADPPDYVGAFTRWHWKVNQRGCLTDWDKPDCVGLRPMRLNGGPAVGASAESDTDRAGWAP